MRIASRLLAVTLLALLAALVAVPASALQVGDKAPDFSLPGPEGKPVKLSDLTAKGPVVLYTFVAAFTPTWIKEVAGFDAALPKFEAAGAQVVGMSADHPLAIAAFAKEQHVKHLLLGDFRRAVLPLYDAMVTDPASPIFRYGKRAYFIIDKQGTVKYMKIMDNPLNLLSADEVLEALKTAGA